MSGKGLLIAAVLLALLSGAVYWSRSREEANKDKPAEGASPKLVTLKESDAERIEIRREGYAPTVLEKKAGKWQITAPELLTAAEEDVSSFLFAVTGLGWDQLVEEKAANLAAFGLDSPALEVQLSGKGQRQTVQVGDESPASGGFYAKLAGDPRVFTISSATKAALEKSPRELRDKRLLTFADDKATKLELTAKGQTVEVAKNAQGDWHLVRPAMVRADGGQVEELLRKLRDLRMDVSAPDEEEKGAAGTFASGARVVLARVTEGSATQQVEVRKGGENYYAQSSVVPGVYKIASGEGLDKSFTDLRSNKLFTFGFNDPSRVEVHAGDRHYVVEKSGEGWRMGGKPVDAKTVQALVDKLRELSATTFTGSGFGAPAVEMTVISEAGKRTDKVTLSKSGTGYVGRREGEPALYVLEQKAVDEILAAAAAVK